MFYAALLVVHIIGACLMAIVGLFTILVLWRDDQGRYRACASMLGVFAAFEISSGVVLSILAVRVSLPATCRDIAIYLATWAALEAVLFIRMKKRGTVFPAQLGLYPVATALAIAMALFAPAF